MNLIEKEIAGLIESHFGRNLVFACIFGSRARQEHLPSSDFDLLIVSSEAFADRQSKSKFENELVELEKRHGLSVDAAFPVEIISTWKLDKAIAGYGFIIDGGRIHIPEIGPSQWNQFNEYRQWLCALAAPSVLLCGDRAKYEELKVKAFGTVLALVSLTQDQSIPTLNSIKQRLLEGGKQYLGFCDTEYTSAYLDANAPAAASFLEKREVLAVHADGTLVVDKEKALLFLPLLTEGSDLNFKRSFLGANSDESDLQPLNFSLNAGVDFMRSDARTISYVSESEIVQKFKNKLPIKGADMNEVLEDFKNYVLSGSVRQSSPGYIAFPDAGNSIAGLCAEMLIPTINQNLIATTKSAPTATFVEVQVLAWLRELVGYPSENAFPIDAIDVGGEMVGGGTMANAVALLAARNKTYPNSRQRGLFGEKVKPILLVAGPTMYHYSHIASFWWLGLGEENIVYVNALSDYRFDTADLDKKLGKYNDGVASRVVAVVCQAGDSRTTTIEDFSAVSEITRKHGVWLHVDACHGGVLIFSSKYRQKIRGIELADSISIDPHKGLCLTYPSSAVLFKDIESFRTLAKSTDITINKGTYDLGQVTSFAGSRPFDSLKLWFLIKNLGKEGIERLIDYRFDLASKWRSAIESSASFEALNQVDLNSVTFTASAAKLGVTAKHLDAINKKIHDEVYIDGFICIHNFDMNVKGERKRVLGVTFGNPLTSASDFPEYVAYLDTIASRQASNFQA